MIRRVPANVSRTASVSASAATISSISRASNATAPAPAACAAHRPRASDAALRAARKNARAAVKRDSSAAILDAARPTTPASRARTTAEPAASASAVHARLPPTAARRCRVTPERARRELTASAPRGMRAQLLKPRERLVGVADVEDLAALDVIGPGQQEPDEDVLNGPPSRGVPNARVTATPPWRFQARIRNGSTSTSGASSVRIRTDSTHWSPSSVPRRPSVRRSRYSKSWARDARTPTQSRCPSA